MGIEITSIVSGDENFADFENEQIVMRLDDRQNQGRPKQSAHESCRRLVFLEWPVGWSKEVQSTDRRQIGVCLSGQLRFEISSGVYRDILPGNCWRLRDTDVLGIKVSVIGDQPAKCLVVQID